MRTITLNDSLYSDLLHAVDWAIDASDSDMGDIDNEQPTVFQELKEEIIAQAGEE